MRSSWASPTHHEGRGLAVILTTTHVGSILTSAPSWTALSIEG